MLSVVPIIIWLKSMLSIFAIDSKLSSQYWSSRCLFISSPHPNILEYSSSAAFFVKVVAKIFDGSISSTKIYFNIFNTITVVFPDPGPATIKRDLLGSDKIAFFCCLFEEMSLLSTFDVMSSNSSYDIMFSLSLYIY